MLRRLIGLIASVREGQRGQAAVFLILLSFSIAATGALAVDIGFWARDARHAQNDADSVVLAAVLELPYPGRASATAVAEQWAEKNEVSSGELDCCEFEDRDGDGQADTVRAWINHKSKSIFARLIGIGDPTVHRKGAAMRVKSSGSSVMPWAAFCDDPSCGNVSANPDDMYVFRVGKNITPGNRNALRVNDPGGASGYRRAITGEGGSDGVYTDGSEVLVDTKTGDMGKNTCDALYDRTQPVEGDVPSCTSGDHTGAECDAITKSAAIDKADLQECRMRTVGIPLTSRIAGPGLETVTIYYTGTFYIGGWARKPWEVEMDGDPADEESVWGFFLEDYALGDPWQLVVDPSNPGTGDFAPVAAVLVE